MSTPGNSTGKGWNVVAVCVTAVCVALVASFTVVVITAPDPDIFLRFLAGPFLGNLGAFLVLIISAVLNRKVNQVQAHVAQVEQNTNGTTTALLSRNRELAAENRDLRVQAATDQNNNNKETQ